MKVQFKYKALDEVYTLMYNSIKKIKIKSMRVLISNNSIVIEYTIFDKLNSITSWSSLWIEEKNIYKTKESLIIDL